MTMMKRIGMVVALACACTIGAVAAEQKPKSAAAAAANLAKVGKESFSGNPSLIACVAGQYYNQHSLGFVVRGTRIRVDIQSGETIDPIATVVLLQMGPNAPNGSRASSAFDDDSGGGNDPRIEITAEYDGNVMVSVGSYDGSAGCYALKAEISLP
jgi:hypothetical protein